MDEIKLLKRKRKAQSEGNNRQLISICTDLSELYIKSGQYEQAIEEYKRLADIYKSERNQIEYAKANRAIGEAYLGLNNYKKALEHQKLHLEIAISEKNDIEIQRAYATIGHIYLTTYLETQVDPQQNLNAAYKYFMKSMKLCDSLQGITKLEKADMQARLLSNLGLVKDSLGDYNKAVELFTTSINICKSNDIYEQLYRGYMLIASLFDKKGDSGKAMHHYNLAIDAAKKLKGCVDLMCTALLSKSEALIKLEDFHTAKKTLYKAYKLNSPNIQERAIIERFLKTVVIMCQTEDKLVIETNDNKELKKLYEKMGDCACNLKNYSKALEYYKLMLTYAEKSGISGRELASCYYSLAETYKDNKMYEEAVKYFEKEYALCTKLQDNLNTLSKIADTKEAGGFSIEEVKAVYNTAIINCRNNNNSKEERRMIMRCIAYLNRVKSEQDLQQFKQQLNSLPPCEALSSSSDNDSEASDKENIDLSNITDISDNSDVEQNPSVNDAQVVAVGKRRSKTFAVKKNAKGESQLHVACINGKVPVVKHLLEQGHPVNVRDNTGWLPLHEACNHGYYEIVELLLDKGAAINDRGGVKCEGITPIYDAANNGHIRIVQLLLDRGASVTIKADNGDTPLNVLKCCHQKYPFAGEEFDIYRTVVDRMSEALKKAGQNVSETVVVHDRIEEYSEEYPEEQHLDVDEPFSEKSDEEEDMTSVGERNFSRSGASPDLLDEYQEIMNNLSKKSSKATKHHETASHQNVGKRSALFYDNDAFDDWLDDDLQSNKATKKRRTSSLDYVVTSSTRNNTSSKNISPSKRLSDENARLINEDLDDVINVPATSPFNKRNSSISRNAAKRKIQASLLDSGFNKSSSRSVAGKSASSTFQRHRSLDHSIRQKKITSFGNNRSFAEADSTVSQPVQSVTPAQTINQIPQQYTQPIGNQEHTANVPLTSDLMVFVDVRIEGKVFRVPVLLSQVQTNTIGWLANQAAVKYARKECSKPCLELETSSGALLSDDDPLSLLFPLGTRQAETVVGRITKLYMTLLVDRYKEACSHLKETVNESLATHLEEVSVKLSVQNKGFTNNVLAPLCKALNHQTTLLELNLSGNFVDVDCMIILCGSLPSLVNLSSLNLRCTGLTSAHLAEMVKMFSITSSPILEKLKHLYIGDNYLRNNAFAHLAEITNSLRLETLDMPNLAFTKTVFKEHLNLKLELKDILWLNVSGNQFSKADVERMISWTTVGKLIDLNVSKNSLANFGLASFRSLECLNLSRCNLQDNDLFGILRACSGGSLLKIDVSYNTELTGISLRWLLEHSTLEDVNLIGCDRILECYSEKCGDCIEGSRKRCIKITADFDLYSAQVEDLVRRFKHLYEQPFIEKGRNLLLLCSKEMG